MASSKAPEPIIWTVRDVRRATALLAIAFPIVLVLGYLVLEGRPVPGSISAYYYSHSMHYVFLGSVTLLGLLLIYYQFRDPASHDAISKWDLDARISTLAGLFAIGVAVFPPQPDCPTKPRPGSLPCPTNLQSSINHAHLGSTVLFFVCIAAIMLFFFTRPVGPLTEFRVFLSNRFHWDLVSPSLDQHWRKLTPKKRWRNGVYVVCGVLMAVVGLAMGVMVLLSQVGVVPNPPNTSYFWGETVSLGFFVIAWLVKGELIPPLNDRDTAPELVEKHSRTTSAVPHVPGPHR
jgi:hypothetical protein